MIIKRVLNHNAVISVTHQGLDVLLMGKGIAFKKRIGDRINSDAIEKSFVLTNRLTCTVRYRSSLELS